MTPFTLIVPASTSNLGPGFDTLGLALRLFLSVGVSEPDSGKATLVLTGEGAQEVPRSEENLLVRAYHRACGEFGVPPRPLALRVHNEIPLQRGLGSSGAAVAAGLALGCLLAGKPLQRESLVRIGAEMEGHAENVSASLLGGLTVSAAGAGENPSVKLTPGRNFHVVLLVPERRVATAAARAILPEAVSFEHAVRNVQNTARLLVALVTGDFGLLAAARDDFLHQPFRERLNPGMRDLMQAAMGAGAATAFLSGSGSTIAALVADQSRAAGVADALSRAARELGLAARCLTLAPDLDGVRIRE